MLDVLWSHVARRATSYLWLLVAISAFGRWFVLSINVSDSLPGTLFLVEKGILPAKGELVAFRYAGGGPYERDALFLKRLIGVQGSVVTAMDVLGRLGFKAINIATINEPAATAPVRTK